MHVLLVGPAHTIHVRRWTEALHQRGISITILSETLPKPASPSIDVVALPGAQLPRVLRYLLGALYVPYLVRSKKIDVVHLHSIGTNAILGLFAPRRRLIITPWGSDVAVLKPKTIRMHLVRWVTSRAMKVLTTSRDMQNQVVKLLNTKPENTEVISWGVNIQLFRPPVDRSEVNRERERWSLPQDKLILTSCRTIAETYRTKELLAAFATVQKTRRDCHLVLVRGFTPTNPQARKLQETYVDTVTHMVTPLSEYVTYIDRPIESEEMSSLLRASDAVIAIPRTDQRSTSALEALATGNRVILSDIPSNREFVEEGAQVELVGEPVQKQLEETLLGLTPADPASRDRNVGFVRMYENWDTQVDKTVDVYHQVALGAPLK